MTSVENYKFLFEQRGFRTRIVYGGTDLVDTKPGSVHDCSDGRGLATATYDYLVLGPQTLGATPGLANYIATTDFIPTRTTTKHLARAIEVVRNLGFDPGYHDITRHGVHCGQQSKMASRQINTLPSQSYEPLVAAGIIDAIGGRSTDRYGEHEEKDLIFNMNDWSTWIPDFYNQRFSIDEWLFRLGKIGIKPQVLVASITEIITLISPVRDVTIMTAR